MPLLGADEAATLLSDIAAASGRALSPDEMTAIVDRTGRLPLALRTDEPDLASDYRRHLDRWGEAV